MKKIEFFIPRYLARRLQKNREKIWKKNCEFVHCAVIQFTLKVDFSALRASILILNETFFDWFSSTSNVPHKDTAPEESWQALDAQKLPILTYLDNHHLNFCFSHSQ